MPEACLDVSRPECSWRPPLEIRGIVTCGGLQGQEWGWAQERPCRRGETGWPGGRPIFPRNCFALSLQPTFRCQPLVLPSPLVLPNPADCEDKLRMLLDTQRERGRPPKSHLPGLRAKGCLSSEADSPLAGLRMEVPAPHPAPGDRPAPPAAHVPTAPSCPCRSRRSPALISAEVNTFSIKRKPCQAERRAAAPAPHSWRTLRPGRPSSES